MAAAAAPPGFWRAASAAILCSVNPRGALPPLEGRPRRHYKRVTRPMGALRGSAAPVVRSLVGPGGGPGAWLGGARGGSCLRPFSNGRGAAQPMRASGARGAANGGAAGPARPGRSVPARPAVPGAGPAPAAGTMYQRLPAGPDPLPARLAHGSLPEAARCSRVELTA